jgi:hypothetical protein
VDQGVLCWQPDWKNLRNASQFTNESWTMMDRAHGIVYIDV